MKTKTVVTLIFTFFLSTALYAQKVIVMNSPQGNSYAVISSEGMPKGFEIRNPANLFYKAPLYTSGGTPIPITDNNGNQMYEDRIVRHQNTGASSYYRNSTGAWVYRNYSPNQNISVCFAVSPVNVYSNGATTSGNGNTVTPNWATANGFLVTGNTNAIGIESSATPMGCSQYRGKVGIDPIGSWRVPTQRELIMIYIFTNSLLATKTTSFQQLASSYYWSSSEASNKDAYSVQINGKDVAPISKVSSGYLRCVRDLVPEK